MREPPTTSRPAFSGPHMAWTRETLVSALALGKQRWRERTNLQTSIDAWSRTNEWRLGFHNTGFWSDLSERTFLLGAVRAWCDYRHVEAIVMTTFPLAQPGVLVIGLTGSSGRLHTDAVVSWRSDDDRGWDAPEWLRDGDIDDDIRALLSWPLWETDQLVLDDLARAAILGLPITETKLT